MVQVWDFELKKVRLLHAIDAREQFKKKLVTYDIPTAMEQAKLREEADSKPEAEEVKEVEKPKASKPKSKKKTSKKASGPKPKSPKMEDETQGESDEKPARRTRG